MIRRICVVCVLAALLALARPSPVRGDPDDAAEEGVQLFERGRFEEAIDTLERARREPPRDASRLGRILLHRGLALAVVGRLTEADAALAGALAYDPTVALDPERFKPALVERLRRLRVQQTGELVVRAARPGARVWVDGRDLGPAPRRAVLPAGFHAVELLGPGVEMRQRLVIRPGMRLDLAERGGQLRAEPPRRLRWSGGPTGELAVRGAGEPAQVLLDGQVMGRAPYVAELPVGVYRVELRSLDGRRRLTREALVVAGAPEALALRLPPEPSAPPRGAPAGAVSPPASEAAPGRPLRLAGWISLGAGLACGGAGLALGLSARADYGAWQDALTAWETTPDPVRQRELEEEMRDREASTEAKALATNILAGVGGGLALAGAVLLIADALRGPPAERAPSTARARAVPGGVEISF